MDTGVFGEEINTYDFETGFNETSLRSIPLPDEVPLPPDTRHLPREILKSATVENLISQNEDLMARLKVALRRLNVIETENQKLNETAAESKKWATVAQDQALVLREKDSAWKEKTKSIEVQAEFLKEKIQALEARLKKAGLDLDRYRKYHDRIRTHVKPHLVELREYARGLEEKSAGQQADIEKREAQVRDLRLQITEIAKNSRYQVEQAELRVHEMIASYEETFTRQRAELESAKQTALELQDKAMRLPRAEQRRDELENEVVELRRNREELIGRFENESRRLVERTEVLASENVRVKLENEDLQGKVMSDYERIRELERQTLDQQSQLDSLRFLYTSRTDEIEKMRIAMAALERLNVDLSARVQELRSASVATGTASSATTSSIGASAGVETI